MDVTGLVTQKDIDLFDSKRVRPVRRPTEKKWFKSGTRRCMYEEEGEVLAGNRKGNNFGQIEAIGEFLPIN
jgi:hypothetical protein